MDFTNFNWANIGSKKEKHTRTAKLTSIFRKLDNELEKDKQKMKAIEIK